MSKYISVGLLLLMMSLKVEAEGIRAVLGEDSVRFIYVTEAWGQEIGSLDVEAGVLSTGTDSTLMHFGVLVQHQNLDSSLKLSVGGRGYYSSIANQNASFIALGGEVLLSPANWSGIGLGASYFTAPSVTTFSDSDSFEEYSVSLNYQLTPQAILSFGYQRIVIKLTQETADRDIEKGSFLGLHIDF